MATKGFTDQNKRWLKPKAVLESEEPSLDDDDSDDGEARRLS